MGLVQAVSECAIKYALVRVGFECGCAVTVYFDEKKEYRSSAGDEVCPLHITSSGSLVAHFFCIAIEKAAESIGGTFKRGPVGAPIIRQICEKCHQTLP
jgi:hypothetical protein